MTGASGGSERLLHHAIAGDRSAIEGLLRLHEPGLLAFLRLRAGPALGGRESAQDVLQDILLQVAQGLPEFEYRGEAQFRGWLYTLAENRLNERARHHRRAKRDLARDQRPSDRSGEQVVLAKGYSSLGGPAADLERREDLERLEAAFEKLSPDDREILSLSYICGLRSHEIAAQLALEEETVRKRKTRARARLASLWGRESE